MKDGKKFFLVEFNALPNILQKVIEVKNLLEDNNKITLEQAQKNIGISTSSYYRYKDSIFVFHDQKDGHTVTLALNVLNRTGVLSEILNVIADQKANVLMINQNIPTSNIVNISITIEIRKMKNNLANLIEQLEKINSVESARVISRE